MLFHCDVDDYVVVVAFVDVAGVGCVDVNRIIGGCVCVIVDGVVVNDVVVSGCVVGYCDSVNVAVGVDVVDVDVGGCGVVVVDVVGDMCVVVVVVVVGVVIVRVVAFMLVYIDSMFE